MHGVSAYLPSNSALTPIQQINNTVNFSNISARVYAKSRRSWNFLAHRYFSTLGGKTRLEKSRSSQKVRHAKSTVLSLPPVHVEGLRCTALALSVHCLYIPREAKCTLLARTKLMKDSQRNRFLLNDSLRKINQSSRLLRRENRKIVSFTPFTGTQAKSHLTHMLSWVGV